MKKRLLLEKFSGSSWRTSQAAAYLGHRPGCGSAGVPWRKH